MRMQMMWAHESEGESDDDVGGRCRRGAGPARDRAVATTPDWYEQYKISQAVKAGGLIHVSGQAGIDEQGRTVADDFLTQGRQAFANVERVLAAAGASLADVVKVGIYLTDVAADLGQVLTLREEFLSEPCPAETLVEVSSLAQRDWRIEVEVTALAR